jgi:hypothetical protein
MSGERREFLNDHLARLCPGAVPGDQAERPLPGLCRDPVGPVRKIARKAYDVLGLHGKVSLPQSVNWSKTKAFTTIRSTGEGVSVNLAGREP